MVLFQHGAPETMGTMLETYHKLQPKHKITDELKVAFQTIWEEMPREHVNKAVAIFTKTA